MEEILERLRNGTQLDDPLSLLQKLSECIDTECECLVCRYIVLWGEGRINAERRKAEEEAERQREIVLRDLE